MKHLWAYIRVLRPHQWTKNGFVFAGFLFSRHFLNANIYEFITVFFAFVIFCMASGFVYIINDIQDRFADAANPEKKHRPIASKKIPIGIAYGYAILIGAASLIASYLLNSAQPWFFVIISIYMILNVLYSRYLKHIVIIDIFVLSSGFLLRALAGTVVLIHVAPTPWFIFFTFSLALLLGSSKRKYELNQEVAMEGKRKVIGDYTNDLLQQIISISATSTLITYSLYTFLPGHAADLLWITIPLVYYGIFRYLYIIYARKGGGYPERVLVKDPHILITVLIYLFLVMGILFYNHYYTL